MELQSPITEERTPPTPVKTGCSGILAIVVLSFWILTLSLFEQLINWSVIQTIFDGSIKLPDFRWAILAAYAILLLIPLGISYWVVKNSLYRRRILNLTLISILALLLSAARLPGITDWQTVAVIQIGICLLFFLSIYLIRRKEEVNSGGRNPIFAILFFGTGLGGLLGIPWVLWGAQGSGLDTLLGLMVSILLGAIFVMVLLSQKRWEENNEESGYKRFSLAGSGWTATLGLIILATAVDQNGNGWLLTASSIPLGFAAAALALNHDGTWSIPGALGSGLVITFGFAWPMIMIDPDELSPIISSGSGEMMEYALKGAGLAFILALLISLVLMITRKWVIGRKPKFLISSGLFLVSWIGIFSIYGFLGNPGFYGEKTFVILKNQADLSTEQQIENPSARRQAVYETLVQFSTDEQKSLREWLDEKGIQYTPYYLVNAIELDADPILRAQIAARGDVDRVLDNPVLRPLSAKIPISTGVDYTPNGYGWNLTMIGAKQVQTELKITGKGIIVGQSDSGVQGDHPELSAQYRGNVDGTNNYNWFDPWFQSETPTDIGGHGTHTLGSILGKNVGVAPGAEWIGCVNLGRNLGNPALYLDCMQFMLAPFPRGGDPFVDGKPEKGANVLNNSWGCPWVEGCDAETYLPAVKALRDAGVFVVASAGNSGYGGCSTVQDPLAIYEDVYSVGAINENGDLAGFSSLGPVEVDGSGRVKPDIVAPGVDVLSSFPGSTYEINSGTSMAGPHVVGVVALMWSANPRLIGDIDRTRAILNETADPFTGITSACGQRDQIPNNQVGYGVVNAYKAVLKAMDEK